MPEFQDAKVEDYEFRGDGKLVRKDRWETGIRSICSAVGLNVREFEIPEVVAAVQQLAEEQHGWNVVLDDGAPEKDCVVDVRLIDGTLLRRVKFDFKHTEWQWVHCGFTVSLEYVVAWRVRNDNAQS